MLFGGEKPKEEYKSPLGDVTDEQNKVIDKVKARILEMKESKDELVSKWLTDMVYYRFCSGWGWDVEKSFKALSATVIWRLEYRPELIKLSDIKEFMGDVKEPVFYHKGYDKEGHPVVYIHLANTHLIKEDKDGAKKFKLVVYVMENVYQKCFPKGRYKCTLVVDVTKIGLTWIGVINRFGKVFMKFGDYYCESLYKAYCVNSGFIIRKLWGVAAAFMHESTKKKFSVEKNCKKLPDSIDVNIIPEGFQGKSGWTYNYLEHLEFERKKEEEEKKAQDKKKEEKVEKKEGDEEDGEEDEGEWTDATDSEEEGEGVEK